MQEQLRAGLPQPPPPQKKKNMYCWVDNILWYHLLDGKTSLNDLRFSCFSFT